jgi:AGCS family alanine or glycine:cation symporter
MVLLGTLVSLPVVWQSADIIMALMAMTNLTAILLLSRRCELSPVIICVSASWASSPLLMRRAIPRFTSSWPRARGMNCRANSAAAIDPTMHFFC